MSKLIPIVYHNTFIFFLLITLFIILIYALKGEIPVCYCHILVAHLFCLVVIIIYSYMWLFFYYYELLFPMLARYNNVLILLFFINFISNIRLCFRIWNTSTYYMALNFHNVKVDSNCLS